MNRGAIVEAIRTTVRMMFPRLEFAGDYEYRAVAQSGALVDLSPVGSAQQLPQLRRVPFRGAPGVAGTLAEGAKVVVRFVNSDPGRPYIAAVIGEDDSGHGPVSLRLVAASSVTVRAPHIVLGDQDTDVDASAADAWVLRAGEAVRFEGSGTIAGSPGALDVIGIISLAPSVLAPGAPPGGRSRVRA